MHIGLLTFHKAPSCGAQLQAWALKTVLEDMGHRVSFPNCASGTTVGNRWPYRRPAQPGFWKHVRNGWKDFLDNAFSLGVFRPAMMAFDEFRRRNFPESSVAPSDFASAFDAVVYGSDQVWNPVLTGPDASLFLGEGVSSEVRKIAYAVSVGDGMPTPENQTRIAHAAESFAAVSVREGKVADIVCDHCRSRPDTVADPTLLVPAREYGSITSSKCVSGPYLYYYALYHCRPAYDRVAALAGKLGLKLVYTPLYQYTRRGMPRGTVLGVSPGDFLAYVAGAACVITDSFHGMALSIVHRKPFVIYQLVPIAGESRPSSLLQRLGMAERLMPLVNMNDDCIEILKKPLDAASVSKLETFVGESRAWLQKAVNQ